MLIGASDGAQFLLRTLLDKQMGTSRSRTMPAVGTRSRETRTSGTRRTQHVLQPLTRISQNGGRFGQYRSTTETPRRMMSAVRSTLRMVHPMPDVTKKETAMLSSGGTQKAITKSWTPTTLITP